MSLIVDFSKTKQIKKSKNPLLEEYDDEMFNLINWIPCNKNKNLSDDIKEYENYITLIRGNTIAVIGLIPLLLQCYIFFNLFVIGFYDNVDLISNDFIILPGRLYEFCNCDNDLPEFYELEYNKIINSIKMIIIHNHIKLNKHCCCYYCCGENYKQNGKNYKQNLTKDELKAIKNFCSVLFRTLYITYEYFNFSYELIYENILDYFGHRYYGDI